jgi:hypothetical protein
MSSTEPYVEDGTFTWHCETDPFCLDDLLLPGANVFQMIDPVTREVVEEEVRFVVDDEAE